MVIKTVDLLMEHSDLQTLLTKAVTSADKLQELNLTLHSDSIVLSGKIKLGLTLPFKTRWKIRVSNDGSVLQMSLSSLSVGLPGMPADAMTPQLMNMLAARLAHYDSVRVGRDTISITLTPLLEECGIHLESAVRELSVTPVGVALKIN
jgi:hypothetical protein